MKPPMYAGRSSGHSLIIVMNGNSSECYYAIAKEEANPVLNLIQKLNNQTV